MSLSLPRKLPNEDAARVSAVLVDDGRVDGAVCDWDWSFDQRRRLTEVHLGHAGPVRAVLTEVYSIIRSPMERRGERDWSSADTLLRALTVDL
jgi:hypothetical protein